MRNKFKYLRPSTSEEASKIKAEYGRRAKCLAGGTDLLLQWRRRETDFEYCLDLTFIPELKYIQNIKKELCIGALTTLAHLEDAVEGNSLEACIRSTVSRMCTPQLRNLATVGGNLCNASPAADLSVLFVALGAQAQILGKSGERSISLEDFFRGVNETVLADDEILTGIRIPLPAFRTGHSFNRVTRTVIDIAQVNTAVSLAVDVTRIVDAKIVLGAVAPVPIRSKTAEQMFVGLEISQVEQGLIEMASNQAVTEIKPVSDIRASAAYRRQVSKVLVRRSIEESIRNLNGAVS
ncbi:Carbon monoxide dehydrogenase medium chain [subsurface metagenome]